MKKKIWQYNGVKFLVQVPAGILNPTCAIGVFKTKSSLFSLIIEVLNGPRTFKIWYLRRLYLKLSPLHYKSKQNRFITKKKTKPTVRASTFAVFHSEITVLLLNPFAFIKWFSIKLLIWNHHPYVCFESIVAVG